MQVVYFLKILQQLVTVSVTVLLNIFKIPPPFKKKLPYFKKIYPIFSNIFKNLSQFFFKISHNFPEILPASFSYAGAHATCCILKPTPEHVAQQLVVGEH